MFSSKTTKSIAKSVISSQLKRVQSRWNTSWHHGVISIYNETSKEGIIAVETEQEHKRREIYFHEKIREGS
jgi:hypothetical protein